MEWSWWMEETNWPKGHWNRRKIRNGKSKFSKNEGWRFIFQFKLLSVQWRVW